MRKLILSIFTVLTFIFISAKVEINGSIINYNVKEIFIYTYVGNSEILDQKLNTDTRGNFQFKLDDSYQGLLRLFLPSVKVSSIVFVNNNSIKFTGKIEDNQLIYEVIDDEANRKFNQYSQASDFPSRILTLNDIQKKYRPTDSFYNCIVDEKSRLEKEYNIDFSKYPFVEYYVNLEKNYLKYETKNDKDIQRVADEILSHLTNDDEKLENTHLLNQLLNVYLTYNVNKFTTSQDQIAGIRSTIDKALDATIIETSRGQNVLLGFIQILKGYGLDYMADEYVAKANALTCTITDDLKSTIRATENTQVGATFENFSFPVAENGYSSIYDLKSKYKLVIFWGSYCSHCKEEKPLLKAFYPEFKAQGGEIIAFGIETNETEFNNFTKGLDWINISDFLFWSSPIVAKYGIEGTPTMFLLDQNNKIVARAAKLSLIQDKIQ